MNGTFEQGLRRARLLLSAAALRPGGSSTSALLRATCELVTPDLECLMEAHLNRPGETHLAGERAAIHLQALRGELSTAEALSAAHQALRLAEELSAVMGGPGELELPSDEADYPDVRRWISHLPGELIALQLRAGLVLGQGLGAVGPADPADDSQPLEFDLSELARLARQPLWSGQSVRFETQRQTARVLAELGALRAESPGTEADGAALPDPTALHSGERRWRDTALTLAGSAGALTAAPINHVRRADQRELDNRRGQPHAALEALTLLRDARLTLGLGPHPGLLGLETQLRGWHEQSGNWTWPRNTLFETQVLKQIGPSGKQPGDARAAAACAELIRLGQQVEPRLLAHARQAARRTELEGLSLLYAALAGNPTPGRWSATRAPEPTW